MPKSTALACVWRSGDRRAFERAAAGGSDDGEPAGDGMGIIGSKDERPEEEEGEDSRGSAEPAANGNGHAAADARAGAEPDAKPPDGGAAAARDGAADAAARGFLFRGIINDLRNRSVHYASDWREGLAIGPRILAPSTFIFFASVIPALTFGQQLYDKTDGQLGVVHVLMSSAIGGLVQAILGGQPLLIVGVAEPVVLIYGFMFEYADNNGIPFMPWVTVTLMYASCMHFVVATLNWCDLISRFTRFSGELFGMLIAGLFLQQAVKGLVDEFGVEHSYPPAIARLAPAHLPPAGAPIDAVCSSDTLWSWRQVNGIFSVCIALGLLFTAVMLRKANTWRFFNATTRALLTDYGPPLMVVIWSLLSHTPADFPKDVPRRISTKSLADSQGGWSVVDSLSELEGKDFGSALVPAFIITVLFFFGASLRPRGRSDGGSRLASPLRGALAAGVRSHPVH